MQKKILLLGYKSFVATGLYEKLTESGFDVDCFTRGEDNKIGDFITGNVFELSYNKFLNKHYDCIVNFILLKNCSELKNLEYIKEVIKLSKEKTIKTLFQVSSVMVYDNQNFIVDEETKIERNTFKKGYAGIKISLDNYLDSLINLPFNILFIRMGYVLNDGRKIPFIKKLFFGYSLIKGDKKSMLPIVKKEDVHLAILSLLNFELTNKVYLFVPSHNKTKYEYAKSVGHHHLITLPKWLILNISRFLKKFRLMSKSFYVRVEGMYIQTKYDSKRTESLLKIKF